MRKYTFFFYRDNGSGWVGLQHFGGMNLFRRIYMKINQVKFSKIQNCCLWKRYSKCTKTKGGSNWKAEDCLGF